MHILGFLFLVIKLSDQFILFPEYAGYTHRTGVHAYISSKQAVIQTPICCSQQHGNFTIYLLQLQQNDVAPLIVPFIQQNGYRLCRQCPYCRVSDKRYSYGQHTYWFSLHFNPQDFDLKSRSMIDIVQVTCQTEVVHEINMVLSFVPIVFSVWFGSFGVFLLTSCAAFFLLFYPV